MSSATVLLLSILAAAIPTFIYIGFIYWVDRYEKEPWWLLTAAFLWGAIPSIIVAYIFNTVLSLPVYALTGGGDVGLVASASLIAPPVEETVKGLLLLGIFFFWRHEIDSPLDGIIYGAMVGMGFAMVENVYYFVNEYAAGGAEAWTANIFLRAVIFGLNHALFSSMTGLGIAFAKMSVNPTVRFVAPVAGWMLAVFLHFLHNLSVSLGSILCLVAFLVALVSDWGGVLLVLIIAVWALVQERNWLKQYLAEEVKDGTLTVTLFETACSGRKRFWFSLNLLFSHGLGANRRAVRFFHRCSELAYKKHHFSLFQDEKSDQLIGRLRREISQLGQQIHSG